jgi:hypothetical protein
MRAAAALAPSLHSFSSLSLFSSLSPAPSLARRGQLPRCWSLPDLPLASRSYVFRHAPRRALATSPLRVVLVPPSGETAFY